MQRSPARSRLSSPRVRRLVATVFLADAAALIVDGWAGHPRWFHRDVAWPLTAAFAILGLLHGVAVVRRARAATD